MPKVHVGDIDINYDVRGAGDPLLLIMGLGGNSQAWSETLLDSLAARFTVITFDNRGTGLTDKPDEPYSLKQMADDAVGVLDAAGVDRSHVFGISMGGMIAQELVLHHPDRVRGLVLGCTNCGATKSVMASSEILGLLMAPSGMPREEAIRRAWPASYSDAYIESHPDELERRLRLALERPTPLHAFQRQLAAIQQFDSYDRLPQIQAPTLVIAGTADRLVPPENSRIIAGRIPGARLHVIEGAAHVFPTEAPEETIRVITEFLTSVGREAEQGRAGG